MKCEVIKKKSINANEFLAIIKLIPENDKEKNAIINTEQMKTTESESALFDHYFNFELPFGQYSLVSLIRQRGDVLNVHKLNV
jgi:hypothetical protein